MTDKEQQLNNSTTGALDARARGLDGATLSRLHQARVKAVEHGQRSVFGLGLLPAGGMTAAALLLLVALLWGPLSPLQQEPAEQTGNGQSVALGDELDLLEEIEFYHWLADGRA